MIYISDTSRTITMPKTRGLSGTLSLRLTNIMTGVPTVLSVVDSSTNPYIYKVVLSLSQARRLDYGEYVYELLVGETVAGQGLLRKPKVYNADTAYTNIEPNIVYGGNSGTVTRYRVHISASVGCSIVVNGETYQTYDKSVPEGTILAVTANPEPGYDFIGWSDGDENQTRTLIVENDVNLYASVEAETYQVTITAGDHGTVSVNGIVGDYIQTVPYGTVLNVQAIPDTGYEFYEWSDGNTNATRAITVTGPISLTSAYATEVYQVTITAGEHCSITVNGTPGNYSARVAYGTQLTLVATPDTGYDFTGWSDGNQSTNRTIIVNGDTNLTTATQIQSFMVNIMTSNPDEGAVVVNGTPGDYITQVNYGTVLNLSTQPTTGYDFLMWSDGVIADQRTITVTDNVTLRATFAVQVMNVSITSPTGNGSFTINGQTYSSYITTVPYCTVLNVEAVPDSHYHFTQWSDGSSSTSKTLHVTSDVTLTGSFAIDQYQVTLSAGANGSISVNGTTVVGTYSQLLDYGTTLNVEAIPDQDYAFNGWSDGSSTNPRTISVTGPVTLSAAFGEVFVQQPTQIIYRTTDNTAIINPPVAKDENDNELTLVSNDYSRGFGVLTYSGVIHLVAGWRGGGNTQISSITLPNTGNGDISIQYAAFNYCTNLTEINFGEDLVGVDYDWLANTAVTSLVFPASFRNFNGNGLAGITTLRYIEFQNTRFDWYGDDAFNYLDSYNGVCRYHITLDSYTVDNIKHGNNGTGLEDDLGWQVVPIEECIIYHRTSSMNLRDSIVKDANGNDLTWTQTSLSNNNYALTFSGEVAYIDHMFYNKTYVDYVQFYLPHLTELGNEMFTGAVKLAKIDISTATAPTVSVNTFKSVAPNGTLNYPANADYSSWLSTDNFYLGWYGWNGLANAGDIYIKTTNADTTVDTTYLKDVNDNQVTLVSSSYDGVWFKARLDNAVYRITDAPSLSPTWVSHYADITGLCFVTGPTHIGKAQMSGMTLNDVYDTFANVYSIGDSAFSYTKINTDITMENVHQIAQSAFANGTLTKKLTISGPINHIENQIFSGLTASNTNADIVFKSTVPLTYVGSSIFYSAIRKLHFIAVTASNATIANDAVPSGWTITNLWVSKYVDAALLSQFEATTTNVNYIDSFKYTTNDSQPIEVNETYGTYEYVNIFDSNTSKGTVLCNPGSGVELYAYNTNLVSVDDMSGIIGYGMFRDCSNLTAVDFTGCTRIDAEAFDGTALANINIPATLTNIGERPFRSDFTNLVVDSSNTAWSDGGCNALIKLDNGNYGNIVTISKYNQPPAGITGFDGWFASGTNRSMALVVPASVTEGFSNCCWFEGCNLNSFVYDGDPSQWTGNIVEGMGIPHYVYEQYIADCRNRWPNEIWNIRYVDDNVIYYKSNNGRTITPNTTSSTAWGVNYVSNTYNAYNGYSVLKFDGPITQIPQNAFYQKSTLKEVVIPPACTRLKQSAFEGCTNLKRIVVNSVSVPVLETYALKSIGVSGELVMAHPELDFTEWFYTIGPSKGWNGMDEDNFCDPYYSMRYNTSTHNVDNSVDMSKAYYYGSNACTQASTNANSRYSGSLPGDCILFWTNQFTKLGSVFKATNVTGAYIPNNVVYIDDLFYNDTSVTRITVPDTVYHIGSNFARGCTSLTRVDFGSRVQYIDSYALYNCNSLTTLYFNGTECPELKSTSLRGLPATGNIYIPSGTREAYNKLRAYLPGWRINTF